jgi:gentisate 1,2-dioxygenase
MSLTKSPAETAERKAYYEKIGKKNMTPLWAVLSGLITPEPKSACRPHLWRYAEARKLLLEAGDLITAKEAERRVLILENPGMPGDSKITTSLYAGLQLVLPGEVAPAHRHSQSALRFIMEGSGAHTTVNGEKTVLEVGDFVITPPNSWHDHGNESDKPIIWLDGLDIPIVQVLDASFAESYPDDEQPIDKPTGHSNARYGANMLPVDYESRVLSSPIFNYPYTRTREALESMRQRDEWDPCHGLKMKYVNPKDGGFAMPTIGAFIQLLPKGFKTARYRSTDATVYVPVEGRGRSQIGERTFDWGPQDVFIAPSWVPVHHEPDEDAVLFSFSDRPVQQKLGLWREDRGNA